MPERQNQDCAVTPPDTGSALMPAGYRRNFWCLTMDFAFFGLGSAFVGPTTVVPSLLTTLGASSAVIGLLSALQRAGWLLPQLIAARSLADKPYRRPYIIVPGLISRSAILLLALVILAAGAEHPALIIGAVILAMAVFWIGDGVGSLAWFDFLGKAIPPHRRGRLSSIGQIVSGILSFAAGFGVEWILSRQGPAYPTNYATLFLLGFGMLAMSSAAISLTVESKSRTASKVPSWGEYLPQLGHVLQRDHAFRRFLIARQVFGLSGLATPFYITYALEQLHLPEHVVGRYTSVGVAGSIVAAVLFGWLNERYGTRAASQVSVPITVAIPVLALLIPRWVTDPTWLAWAYGLVFLMNQASASCYLASWTGYVLEWATDADRPLYVGLTNLINGFTALFAIVGGLILQWTNGNYPLLFIITAIGTLLALPLSFTFPEPRRTERVSVLS